LKKYAVIYVENRDTARIRDYKQFGESLSGTTDTVTYCETKRIHGQREIHRKKSN
jgi:hypothetical protein